MTPENFVYWLQGYFELSRRGTVDGNITLDSTQVKIIEDHLKLTFNKVTPTRNPKTDIDKIFKDVISNDTRYC
jgi:hypothetical protein